MRTINQPINGTVNSIYPHRMPDGCVLYYDMQDTGTKLLDQSGNSLHGTVTGAVAQVGNQGYVRYFDGVDDRINCGRILDFGTNSDFSVEVWVMMSQSITNWRGILGRANASSQDGWLMRHTTGGNLGFYMDDVNSATYTSVADTTDRRGKWTHAVVVADRDTATRLYANGTLVGTGGSSLFDATNPNEDMYVGRISTGIHFAGQIGLVRVYNRALTSNEIKQGYAEHAPRFGLAS